MNAVRRLSVDEIAVMREIPMFMRVRQSVPDRTEEEAGS